MAATAVAAYNSMHQEFGRPTNFDQFANQPDNVLIDPTCWLIPTTTSANPACVDWNKMILDDAGRRHQELQQSYDSEMKAVEELERQLEEKRRKLFALRMQMDQYNQACSGSEALLRQCKDYSGSRQLQDYLPIASDYEVRVTWARLKVYAVELMKDQYAHFLVEELMKQASARKDKELLNSIFTTTLPHTVELAKHQRGVRALSELWRQSDNVQRSQLASTLKAKAAQYLRHSNAHRFIQCILATANPELSWYNFILHEVERHALHLVTDTYGTHVVEAVLQFLPVNETRHIAKSILRNGSGILTYANHAVANYVLSAVINNDQLYEFHGQIVSALAPHLHHLVNSKYSAKLMQSLLAKYWDELGALNPIVHQWPKERRQQLMKTLRSKLESQPGAASSPSFSSSSSSSSS